MRFTKLFICMGIFSFLLRGSTNAASDWLPTPERKLVIYIGWPLQSPTEWRRVKLHDTSHLELEDGTSVNPTNVHSHLLVYPNNEVLGGTNLFSPLPSGLKFLEPQTNGPKEPLRLDSAQVAFGKAVCRVSHSRFRTDSDGKKVYATTLQNISRQRIKIQKFAAFYPAGEKYIISTVSRTFYSADQFQSWYATAADGWINPGEKVTDDSNYGSGMGIWAYFGETQDGNYFIATVSIPK